MAPPGPRPGPFHQGRAVKHMAQVHGDEREGRHQKRRTGRDKRKRQKLRRPRIDDQRQRKGLNRRQPLPRGRHPKGKGDGEIAQHNRHPGQQAVKKGRRGLRSHAP